MKFYMKYLYNAFPYKHVYRSLESCE